MPKNNVESFGINADTTWRSSRTAGNFAHRQGRRRLSLRKAQGWVVTFSLNLLDQIGPICSPSAIDRVSHAAVGLVTEDNV